MGLLSWWSGTRRGGTQQGPAASAAPDTPGASATPAVPGWLELPALQRTLAEPELVTDPGGFRGSLDTWRDSSFLTPLGHLVSPQAPSGLGHGLATPGASHPPDADSTAGAPATPTVSRVFDPPRSGGGDPAPSGAPAVALQRVTDSGVMEPLTSARPPAMRIRRLPALPVAPAQRAVPDTETALPAVQRRSAASAPPRPHPFGLGEPLAGLPPTAQRTPAASTGAIPLDDVGGGAVEAERAEVSRPLLGDDPLEVRTADSEPVPPTPLAPPTSPVPLPTAPTSAAPTAATPPPGRSAEPAPSAADRPPVPIQRASAAGTPVAEGPTAPAAGPVVPLVAQRSVPLFSGARPPSADSPSGVYASAGPPVVPVRWSDPNEGPHDPPGGAGSGSAAAVSRAVGASGVPSAQRSAVSAASPPPPSVSRSVPGVAAGPSKSSGGRLVDAGAVAIAAGVAQRMADGSVVFRPPTPSPSPPLSPSPPSSPLPGTAIPTVPSVSLPPPVQRDSENTGPPSPEPAPEPAPEPPEGSGSAAAPPTDPPPPTTDGKVGPQKVDDELVRALYAPLSRLLKAELRLERERAGSLINTRH
ncbi:hypothetical protein AB0H03_16670 [Streptomyces sparsogenes]|uniref:hypothetical protein n=1 Tax=Streptomyces sparsogenes TaxID=67365 RepID=UPI0033C344D2